MLHYGRRTRIPQLLFKHNSYITALCFIRNSATVQVDAPFKGVETKIILGFSKTLKAEPTFGRDRHLAVCWLKCDLLQLNLVKSQAPYRKFYGHSAHVTNVKFTHDDQYLLSAGGDDSWYSVLHGVTIEPLEVVSIPEGSIVTSCNSRAKSGNDTRSDSDIGGYVMQF